MLSISFILILGRVAFGFMLPLNGKETLNEDSFILNEKDEMKTDIEQPLSATKGNKEFIVLPFTTVLPNQDLKKAQEIINETALYEHAATKKNNVNERSFIIINQRYKTPVLSTQLREHRGPGRTHISLIGYSDALRYKEFPQKILTSNNNHVPITGFIDLYVRRTNRPYTSNIDDKVNERNDVKMKFGTGSKTVDGQLQYLELLNAPLLRHSNNDNTERNKNVESSGSHLLNDNYSNESLTKHNLNKNEELAPQSVTSVPQNLMMKSNYGFMHQKSNQGGSSRTNVKNSKGLELKNNVNGFDMDILSDYNMLRFSDDTSEENRLFDRFLKNALMEPKTNDPHDKNGVTDGNDCNRADCSLKISRQYNNQVNKKNSKCGRHRGNKILKGNSENGIHRKKVNKNVVTSEEIVNEMLLEE